MFLKKKKGRRIYCAICIREAPSAFHTVLKKKKKRGKKVVKTCSLGTSFPPRNKGDLCVGLEARQGVWHNDRWGAFLERGWKRGGLCASALFPQRTLFRPARLWLPPRRLASSWAGALDVSERRSPVRGKTDVCVPPPPSVLYSLFSRFTLFITLRGWRDGSFAGAFVMSQLTCGSSPVISRFMVQARWREKGRERENKNKQKSGIYCRSEHAEREGKCFVL